MVDASLYQGIGQRIRRTREALRMSQEELARQLNYNSPATISYYESGARKISIADLQRIAAILGLPLAHFLEEDVVPDPSFFRLRAQEVRPAARKPLAAFLAFAQKHGGSASVIPDELAAARPGQAADWVLRAANIDQPPVSPQQAAAHLGIPVYEWDFPDEISGIFVAHQDVVCIGVNEQHPHVRQRFTVGHELGHCIFRDGRELFVDFTEADPLTWSEDDRRRAETKANQFAADLLMPRAWLREDVRQHDLDIALLARRYEVSEQALWFRLLALILVEHKAGDASI